MRPLVDDPAGCWARNSFSGRPVKKTAFVVAHMTHPPASSAWQESSASRRFWGLHPLHDENDSEKERRRKPVSTTIPEILRAPHQVPSPPLSSSHGRQPSPARANLSPCCQVNSVAPRSAPPAIARRIRFSRAGGFSPIRSRCAFWARTPSRRRRGEGGPARRGLALVHRRAQPLRRGGRATGDRRGRAADRRARRRARHVRLSARSRAEGLRVFEVDHPATQAEKRRRLAAAGIAAPAASHVRPLRFRARRDSARSARGRFRSGPARLLPLARRRSLSHGERDFRDARLHRETAGRRRSRVRLRQSGRVDRRPVMRESHERLWRAGGGRRRGVSELFRNARVARKIARRSDFARSRTSARTRSRRGFSRSARRPGGRTAGMWCGRAR